jgi:hypothetical protein
MVETEVVGAMAQFGAAGLIGWMWLSERRAAAARDRQLAEAHERLMQERGLLHALFGALENNTRAMAAVEVGQRRLAELLGDLCRGRRAGRAAGVAGPVHLGAGGEAGGGRGPVARREAGAE